MQTSDAGIALIKRFEGLELEAYPDPATGAEPYTIGYGHTGNVSPGDRITEAAAELLLLDDLKEAEAAVERLVIVPLNDNQFSALVSFVFNLGTGNFNGSTLLRRLNDGDYQAAALEFGKWIYGNGKPMAGLMRRREAERQLFVTPTNWYDDTVRL